MDTRCDVLRSVSLIGTVRQRVLRHDENGHVVGIFVMTNVDSVPKAMTEGIHGKQPCPRMIYSPRIDCGQFDSW